MARMRRCNRHPRHSSPATPTLVQEALALFGYTLADLDDRIPPAVANGGAHHLILALKSRDKLRAMRYELAAGRELMRRYGFATISLIYAETPQRFHARNPFASGGVYEDPATGAAAAALAGYLRDLDWPHGGAIDIIQGEDMGAPCHLQVQIPAEQGQFDTRGRQRALIWATKAAQSHFFSSLANSPLFSSCSTARCTRSRTAGSTWVPIAM